MYTQHPFQKFFLLAFLLLTIIASNTAYAIINSGANPIPTSTYNLPLDNIGHRGTRGSGVYIGNSWVLTSKWVGAGNITLGDTVYYYDGVSAEHIKNPEGYDYLTENSYADLVLFRLTEEPDLPTIRIATEHIESSTRLYHAGYSAQRETDMSYWEKSGPDINPNWEEIDESVYDASNDSHYWGYKTTGSQVLNWGYAYSKTFGWGSAIDARAYHSDTSWGTESIVTQTSFTPYEKAQAAYGDFGGGTFRVITETNDQGEEESYWALSGIMSCAIIDNNAPVWALEGALTVSVDLSYYSDPILAIVNRIPGDANGDLVVDGSDATILANNWQYGINEGETASWTMGDFNYDGIVDGSDVTILANNWQTGVDMPSVAVPEPTTITLLGSGLSLLFLLRRRPF